MADPKPAGETKEDQRTNWAKLAPGKAAARVFRMVDAHEKTLGWRHRMAQRGAASWSGYGLGDLFEGLSPFEAQIGRQRRGRPGKNGGWGSKTREQHARATMETLAEKITGLDEPKCQMVATDAEWEERRQGVWADRFVEGNMHLPQGSFLDTWDLARHGFLLAGASTGMVAARVEPDYVSKCVRTQLRSTLNTFIDPADMGNGNPLSYFDITWENPEYMIEDERFKPHRDKIWAASKIPPHHTGTSDAGATFGTQMVKWVSAWRMPFGAFKGREAVFINGHTILWEDWEPPEPPLAFFRMNRCLGDSFWAENFVEIMLDPLLDAEEIDDIVRRTMERSSQTIISLDGAATGPKGVLDAHDVSVFKYNSKKNEKPPEVHKPGLLHPDFFAYRDRKLQIAQQLSGVPDMHRNSQSPSGTDSGRAKRLEASLLPERFAKKMRGWRHWIAVDIAKRQIRAARAIGKREPNWQLNWSGADFDATVSVEVLDIDDKIYTMRPYVVSEQKNTPADRAASAEEWLEKKLITPEQFQIIQSGLYDTPKETRELSAQRRYVAKVVDEILHAPESEIEDEARYMSEQYMPPDPWIDAPAALAQALPIYRNAMIDGVKQNRRGLMRRFLEDITAVKMAEDRANAMQQASVSIEASPMEAFGAPPPGGAPQMPGAMPAPPGAPPMSQPVMDPAINAGGVPGLA